MPDIDTECLACGGPLEAQGALGNRVHLKCRNCGIWTSIETTPNKPAKKPRTRGSK